MVVFPILWSLLQSLNHGQVTSQWQPLTLQGAGLFHLAMGAVLGIAAFGRTQEKLGGANNGGIQTPTTRFQAGTTTPSVLQATRIQQPYVPTGFNGTSANDFYQPQTRVGYGGKLAPEQPLYPQL
jgi:hypothetical protein